MKLLRRVRFNRVLCPTCGKSIVGNIYWLRNGMAGSAIPVYRSIRHSRGNELMS
jgi:hypothetical protein